MPITYVSQSQLCCRKMLKSAYMEGADLLSKHKQQVLEGQEEAGQLVTSPSFLERIIATAAEFSISSLASGLNKQQCLSSSVVQNFQWYTDCADLEQADLEDCLPLSSVYKTVLVLRKKDMRAVGPLHFLKLSTSFTGSRYRSFALLASRVLHFYII